MLFASPCSFALFLSRRTSTSYSASTSSFTLFSPYMVVSRHLQSHDFLINFSNLFASAPNAVLLPTTERLIVVGYIFALAGSSFKSSRRQASEPQHRADCVLVPPAAGCVCMDRCKYFSRDGFRPLKQTAVLPRLLLLVPSSAQPVCDVLTTRKKMSSNQCRHADFTVLQLHECARLVFGGS